MLRRFGLVVKLFGEIWWVCRRKVETAGFLQSSNFRYAPVARAKACHSLILEKGGPLRGRVDAMQHDLGEREWQALRTSAGRFNFVQTGNFYFAATAIW